MREERQHIDGDVFGWRIDGVWQPTADKLRKDAPWSEVADTFDADACHCFRRCFPPHLPLAWRCAEVVQGYRSGQLSAAEARTLLNRETGSAYPGSEIARAAQSLLERSDDLLGLGVHDVLVELARQSIRRVATAFFIDRAVSGALGRGAWTHDQATVYRSGLCQCLERRLQSVRLTPKGTLSIGRPRHVVRIGRDRTRELLDMVLNHPGGRRDELWKGINDRP